MVVFIASVLADRPLALGRRQIGHSPVILKAADGAAALAAAEVAAREFFPAQEGWVAWDVQGVAELDWLLSKFPPE